MYRLPSLKSSVFPKAVGVRLMSNVPLSKIVATIGPASENLPVLPQVVGAGMRIMRVNFSHATYEEADLRMKNLKLSPGKLQRFTKKDICVIGKPNNISMCTCVVYQF